MTFVVFDVFSQFIVAPIRHTQNKPQSQNAKKLAVQAVLSLPFWDDFSYSDKVPDPTMWVDSENVFINSSLAINPPTVNVATFDGANGQGVPYNPLATTPEVTDQLESNTIDLSGLSESDNVVLSFYWQFKGNGNQPNSTDSLRLKFLNSQGFDTLMWSEGGIDTVSSDIVFHETRIPVTEKFLYDGFSFKFESFGNTGGSFDLWHIDYVYLNRNRPKNGPESLVDHAIAAGVSSIFTPYTTVPRSQLFEFGDTLFTDMTFAVSNLENASEGVDYTYNLLKIDTNSDESITETPLITPYVFSDFDLLDPYEKHRTQIIPALSIDAFNSIMGSNEPIHLVSDISYQSTDTGIFLLNNQWRTSFEIDEILAYDDGTAESSAGVKSESGGAQIAVFYSIPVADYLTHVDINFPSIKGLPEKPRFKLSITKSLTDDNSNLYTSQEFSSADSISAIDRFMSFEFSKPVNVQGGFYVIFEQFTSERFPIGLDQNTHNGDKIFLNYGSGWEPNNVLDVNGSLMIRPRFGSDYTVTGVSNEVSSSVSIYPNPTHNLLNIEGSFDRYELYNLSGQKILSGKNTTIRTHGFIDGIYVLKIFKDQNAYTHKVIVRH